eukprot:CAMPEP_0204531972 /NCGR_PEP_ID=MMETSP0661-20131031/11467_1 /ASSEMBLY_ACC=CAM_ASM_000606 /TAXON_ID=109239 /ORGANISM="Alexandrium margalefi, Strain AMGDE01CS-322" /LENGTH=512 /DNA_ID=CAMNT_0051538171 /DNA_START=365 /DNA_END=1903 /DNA_ORIENTATION=-
MDPRDASNIFNEIIGMLTIDVSLTVAHVFFPIRSCRLWVLSVALTIQHFLITCTLARSGYHFLTMDECNSIFFVLLVLALFAFLGGWRNEKRCRSDWLAQRALVKQQGHLDQQAAAMARILGRLCDSLVRLGPDLQILGPGSSLEALLFRQSLAGRSFCDLLASDSEQLVGALRGSSAESVTEEEWDGGMLHIILKDSHGQLVKVYAHHACFHAADGEVQYLLGLVEIEERQYIPSDVLPVAKPIPFPELSGAQEMSLRETSEGTLVIASMSSDLLSLLGSREGELPETVCHSRDRTMFSAWLQEGLRSADAGRADAGVQQAFRKYGMLCLVSEPDNCNAIAYQAKVSGRFALRDESWVVTLRVQPPQQQLESSLGSSGRGTPAHPDCEELADLPSKKSNISLVAPKCLANPKFKQATVDTSQMLSLAMLLSTWNIEVSRTDCCRDHARVQECFRQLTALRNCNCRECRRAVHQYGVECDWQCAHCGILGDQDDIVDDICKVCGNYDGGQPT